MPLLTLPSLLATRRNAAIRSLRLALGAFVLGSLLFSLSPALHAQAGRTSYTLRDGWRYHTGAAPEAVQPGFDDSHWDAVTIPHVFPLGGDNPYYKQIYRGESWYRRAFDAPAAWKGKRIFLRFGAVGMASDTYLNGKQLGEHLGGFTAFIYEITDAVSYGGHNIISVRVDDRNNTNMAPLEQSLQYGGIYRPVTLLVTDAVAITPLDYASPGVFLTQLAVSPARAEVQVRTEVDSNLTQEKTLTLRLLLIDDKNNALFKAEATGPIAPGKMTPITQTMTIPHPHLWNGVADPYLYTVRLDLMDGTTVLDTVTQPLGLRSYKFNAGKGFALNGKDYLLHGVCLHQDWGDKGWAVTPKEEEGDLTTLRDMGANALRLVHYPHSQSALSLYDRTGMIAWEELPLFGQSSPTTAFSDNVKMQLTEMLRQNYNHPSIVVWSLFNELNSKNKVFSMQLVGELNKIVHKEDPTRPTVGASNGDDLYNMHDMVTGLDLIAFNDYPGWYFGAPTEMDSEITKWNGMYDSRGTAVSEYGAGAKVTDHKQGLNVNDVKPVDPYGNFQPEEWQALVHEADYAAIKAHPEVWGSFIWLAFDSGGVQHDATHMDGGNIKGLVTQDRSVKKDAYFFYQANWSPTPMVYLTSRRDTQRTNAVTAVKAYTNDSEVTLKVNGVEVSREKPNSLHIVRWEKITLAPGANKIELSTPEGQHDEAVWTLGGASAPASPAKS
jgi:beta-galactosidase